MKSYNQIINTLLNFASAHLQVNSAGEGFSQDLNEFLKNNNDGSFLFYELRSIQQNTNLIDYNIRVYAVDFKQKDSNNLRDVISDTAQILVDLRKYLINNWQTNSIFSTQFDSTTLLPVNNFSADYLAGFFMDIKISSALIESDCDIPAMVNNCPAVAFYLNDVFVGSAFDSLFYNVVNDDGGQVGSIVGGQWVVPFNAISVQNNQGGQLALISSFPAGGIENLGTIKVFDGINGDNAFGVTNYPTSNLIINRSIESISLSGIGESLYINFSGSSSNYNFSVTSTDATLSAGTNSCGENFAFQVPNSLIQNSNSSFSVSLPATSSLTLTDIVITTESGTVIDPGYPAALNLSLDNFNLNNSTGGTPAFDYEYPGADPLQLGNITVTNVDGQSQTLPFSFGLAVNFSGVSSAGGILYQRPHYNGLTTSYANGDVGWQVANGGYNYSTTATTIQRLDFDAADPMYTLVNDNEFGTKIRFTNDAGGAASDSKAQFEEADFGGATLYYIIDHLTGLGWLQFKVAFGNNWTTSIAAAHAFSYSGSSDWRLPSRAEFNSAMNYDSSYYLTSNIWNRSIRISGVSGSDVFAWHADTDETVSTRNAFRINSSGDMARASKTSTSSYGAYVCRTHYS